MCCDKMAGGSYWQGVLLGCVWCSGGVCVVQWRGGVRVSGVQWRGVVEMSGVQWRGIVGVSGVQWRSVVGVCVVQ